MAVFFSSFDNAGLADRMDMRGLAGRMEQASTVPRLKLNSNAEAICWVAFGTALFSLTISSGKFASLYLGLPITTSQIMIMRYVGGCLTILLIVVLGAQPLRSYRSNRPGSHLIRALFGVISGWLLIQASTKMPSVDATALSLFYVVFIVVLGMLVLRERLSRQHVLGIALCCFGAALMMTSRGAFQDFNVAYAWPALLALLGAAVMAFEGLLIKILAEADRPIVIIAHVNVFALGFAIPAALFEWASLTLVELLPFMLLGPMALFAQYCFVRGYALADIAVVGPAEYVWLVYSALIGIFVFDEVPTSGIVLGAVIIGAGGIVLAMIRPKGIPPVEDLS